MAIAVLSALLIHVVWLTLAYKHQDARNQRRVRALGAFSSWGVTTALFCLIYTAYQDSPTLHGVNVSDQAMCQFESPQNYTKDE